MNQTFKVILIEDNRDYRDAIEISLKDDPEIELTGQFGTAELALNNLQYHSAGDPPDLILLDLNLPGMSGHEAIPWLKELAPKTEIIVLTQSDKEADVIKAITLGASGYLLKSAMIEHIQEGIRTVMSGSASIDPKVARMIMNTMKAVPAAEECDESLTEREHEVLSLLAEGLVKKEIADRLNILSSTVSSHIKNIYQKLNVNNAPSAIDRAHRTGLFRKKSGS